MTPARRSFCGSLAIASSYQTIIAVFAAYRIVSFATIAIVLREVAHFLSPTPGMKVNKISVKVAPWKGKKITKQFEAVLINKKIDVAQICSMEKWAQAFMVDDSGKIILIPVDPDGMSKLEFNNGDVITLKGPPEASNN
ncbi:hypothetical protein O9G_005380, partial [Rozella allomycis CSF55]